MVSGFKRADGTTQAGSDRHNDKDDCGTCGCVCEARAELFFFKYICALIYFFF